MRMKFLAFYIGAIIFFFWQGQGILNARDGKEMFSSSVSPGYSPYQNFYDVHYYQIELEASDTSTFISGNARVGVTMLGSTDTLAFELQAELSVDSVLVSGLGSLPFQHVSDLILILLPESAGEGEVLDVQVFYSGNPARSGFFSGLTNRTDINYGIPVTYTLSEPFQASSWFPVKQDLKDKTDSVRVCITVDSDLMAGSNGILEEIRAMPGGKKQYRWFSSYPTAYYLISFSAASYIDYSFYCKPEGSRDSILIQNYIYNHPDILTREEANIRKTGDLISLFSELFGLYPFSNEKYGHCMAPMGGGMEHQTMTTLQNFNFLLVAHELAHQWFGDHVTCSGWEDIWINEGFASYCEYLALEFLDGKDAARPWMDGAHGAALRIDDGSVYLKPDEVFDPVRIFSPALSYKKGAAVLHMLRHELEDDGLFFDILKTFLSRYSGGVAGTLEFSQLVGEMAGKDYSWFFDQWIYGSGFPYFQAGWRQRGDSLLIKAFQTGSRVFSFKLDFQVIFEDGSDSIFHLRMDEADESFSLGFEKKIILLRLDPDSNTLLKSTLYEILPESGSIDVGPNPFSHTLYLSFLDYLHEKTIRITGMNGQVFFEEKLEAGQDMELDLGHLPPGLYLLLVSDPNNSIVRKLLKI